MKKIILLLFLPVVAFAQTQRWYEYPNAGSVGTTDEILIYNGATRNATISQVLTDANIPDGVTINNTSTTTDNLTVNNNIVVGGMVDGRDIATDGTKLDGVETGATADQSNAEIATAVEAATDSNTFTDADHSKLDGIEASATADQSNAEIAAAVEAATDSNTFTDADHSKLNGIEASADVTDETNVTSALDGATLTDVGTPASGDLILLQDASDSNNLKAAQFSTFGGGGGMSDLVDDTTPQLGGQLDVNGNAIGDGTRELITFTEDASAVNHVEIENEATGSGPTIRAAGDDTNIDLNIDAKGSGNVIINGLTITSLSDPNSDDILFWDDSDGGVEFLTLGNALTITTNTLDVDAASTTADGACELATTAETTTGTDTARCVTPDGLEDGFDGSANIVTVGTIATGTWGSTISGATLDADSNTVSGIDLGNEAEWAAIGDVSDRSAFASGDKILIFEAGVGMRKVDYDDLPGAGGGMTNFTAAGDSGSSQTIADGNTLTIAGDGVGIDTVASATDTITINYVALDAESENEGVIDLQDLQGAVTDGQVPNTITIDNAGTADALSANGANCSAGNYPLGVDASGAVESCTADSDTQLTEEQVEDFAGPMVATGGTKTGITVTYQDVTNDMDFVVDNATALGNLSGTNTGDEASASVTVSGVVELATTAETTTGTDTARAVTPDGLEDGYNGSTNVTTLGTISTGTWQGTAINQTYLVGQSGTNTGDESTATTSAEGVVELSTTAEATTGTATNRAVTPDALADSTFTDSIYWPAGALAADGTNCAVPASATINSGPVLYTIICTDSASSAFYGQVTMPDGYNGGTVTFELAAINTAADTNVFEFDFSGQCRGDSDAVNSTWGTAVAGSITFSTANDIEHVTTAAVTPNGTCAAGDTLFWRAVMDNTATTTAVATAHVVGVKMEFTTVRSD